MLCCSNVYYSVIQIVNRITSAMAKTIIKKPARAAVKAPAKPTVITSIRLQTDIKAALDKASEAEERSVSWLVAKVMSDWLRSKKYLK